MRHQKSGRHLNRTSSHRKAMLSNMSASLIEHETIKTTVIKAKELRRYVEPLITLSKVDSVANRRRAFAKLRSKSAVGKLFTDLGPRYQNRPGGYTRILKAGFRRGDSAMIAYMQLVDQPLVEREDYGSLMDSQEEVAEGSQVVSDETTQYEGQATEASTVVEEVAEEAEVKAESTDSTGESAVESSATADASEESTEVKAEDATTEPAESEVKSDDSETPSQAKDESKT